MIPIRLFLDADTGALYEVGIEQVPGAGDTGHDGDWGLSCTCLPSDAHEPCAHILHASQDISVDPDTNELTLTMEADQQDMPSTGSEDEIRAWLVEHSAIEVL